MDKVFINEKPLYLITDVLDTGTHLIRHYKNAHSIRETINELNDNASIPCLYLLNNNIHDLQAAFLNNLRYIKAAGGIVKNTNDELLFILRHGKWDLPKGKMETGESIEETALREVQEECGISDLKIIRELPSTYHVYKMKGEWALKHTWWYFMQYTGTEIPIPQEEESITEVRWFSVNKLFIPFGNIYKSIADLVFKGFVNVH